MPLPLTFRVQPPVSGAVCSPAAAESKSASLAKPGPMAPWCSMPPDGVMVGSPEPVSAALCAPESTEPVYAASAEAAVASKMTAATAVARLRRIAPPRVSGG